MSIQPNSDKAISKMSNADDKAYLGYMARFHQRFGSLVNPAAFADKGKPLFLVDAGNAWRTFIESLPIDQRQYHNCCHCQFFFERYAGLVTSTGGVLQSAIWNLDDTLPMYLPFVRGMQSLIQNATIREVFYHDEPYIGHPVTEDRWGKWHHFGLVTPAHLRATRTETANQLSAKKAEDYKTMCHALSVYKLDSLRNVAGLLQTDALYRQEKIAGPFGFLLELAEARNSTRGPQRINVTYEMIAAAPDGFLHPRSSMIGTLLDDLEAGKTVDQAFAAFARKMAPTAYQRPQAMPAAGAVRAAEAKLEALGAARSLERRFARLAEVTTLWKPKPMQTKAAGGVFGHLMDKAPETLEVGTIRNITFEKLCSTVLPNAVEISVYTPAKGNYAGVLTAVHYDAPPILRWDREVARNPFSTYVYTGGSSAGRWGLASNSWVPCLGLMLDPPHWFDDSAMDSKGATLILAGAMDGGLQSSAIFPETLKSEFHSMRSTIEAHSARRPVPPGIDQGACGLQVVGATVRVQNSAGIIATYKIDRWD